MSKRFIIPLQKNCYFAIGFYYFGKSIQKHPDSVCENDVNNEQTIEREVDFSTAKLERSEGEGKCIFFRKLARARMLSC